MPETTARPALPRSDASSDANFRPNAEDRNHRRRRIEGGESEWKIRLDRSDQAATEFRRSLKLALRFRLVRNLQVPRRSATACKTGQLFERDSGRMKSRDQSSEGNRPHILRAR